MSRRVAPPSTKPKKTGLASVPSQLQLPGGVTVKGYDFRITRLGPDNEPLAFELVTDGSDSDCVLWAATYFVEQPLPETLLRRVRDRVREDLVARGSDVVMPLPPPGATRGGS